MSRYLYPLLAGHLGSGCEEVILSYYYYYYYVSGSTCDSVHAAVEGI